MNPMDVNGGFDLMHLLFAGAAGLSLAANAVLIGAGIGERRERIRWQLLAAQMHARCERCEDDLRRLSARMDLIGRTPGDGVHVRHDDGHDIADMVPLFTVYPGEREENSESL